MKNFEHKIIELCIQDSNGEKIGFNSPDNTEIKLVLKISKDLYAKNVILYWQNEEFSLSCERDGVSFTKIFNTKELGVGLYHFHYQIIDTCGKMYFYVYDGEIDGLLLEHSYNIEQFSFLVYSSSYKTPDRFKGGIMYQIFPDRFLRSGKVNAEREDSVVYEDWENGIPEYAKYPGGSLKNNTFFCGDLYGVAEKLDYLLSLGVDIIYLNPIFKAYSNHRYDTGDYMQIDELLGGEEAFKELISQCKKRNIKIILDGVFNHTGDNSIYFNKYGKYGDGGAYRSKKSEYYNWYSFSVWNKKYESWWGIDILPRVKSDEPSYREFINGENGVVRKYLKMGVDGWRLDVADELSDDFIVNLRKAAKAEKEDSIVYGEVWEDASTKISYGKERKYLQGFELDSVMNYPIKNAITSYLISGNSDIIYKAAEKIYSHYPKPTVDVLMNMLGTHDTPRILTVLAGMPDDGMPNDYKAKSRLSSEQRSIAKKRLTLAICLIMTLPGIPSIYYGDEAGMEGYGDPFNRFPYPWGKEDMDILGSYRRFAAARLSSDVYKDGKYRCLVHENSVFAFERYNSNASAVTVVNGGSGIYTMKLEKEYTSLLTGIKYKDSMDILPMTCDILVAEI
ncbi:MAG: glycoside hydrolase family 13 protein [Ruminococcaceae bacterium]|nr:glycoside hydrolase family 13 protein [Oscillospiraceae bacterium]